MSGWHNDKPDKRRFPCDVENCDKAYNMKQSLNLHKKICHSTAVQEIKCVCEVCGKLFKTSNALKVRYNLINFRVVNNYDYIF